MPRDTSDLADDPGRMDSERQLRNKRTSRWLEDMVKQAERDHKEMLAAIEERKGAADTLHGNFLGSLDNAVQAYKPEEIIDRSRQEQDLLANSAMLLKLYHFAEDKVEAIFGGQDPLEAMQKSHEADMEKLKDVLLAGKRLCAGELEGVEQQARAKEFMGKEETYEQAEGIFGRGAEESGGERAEETLTCVERGVKRMVKGME